MIRCNSIVLKAGMALLVLGGIVPAVSADRGHRRLRLGVHVDVVAPGYHVIEEVEEGSPAEAIGLKPGLVIIAIDGKLVRHPHEVQRQIQDADKITVLFRDKRKVYEVTAELEEDDSGYGMRVKGTPQRRAVTPPKKR